MCEDVKDKNRRERKIYQCLTTHQVVLHTSDRKYTTVQKFQVSNYYYYFFNNSFIITRMH